MAMTIASNTVPMTNAVVRKIIPIILDVQLRVNACAILPMSNPLEGYLSIMLFHGLKNVFIRKKNENISLNAETYLNPPLIIRTGISVKYHAKNLIKVEPRMSGDLMIDKYCIQ